MCLLIILHVYLLNCYFCSWPCHLAHGHSRVLRIHNSGAKQVELAGNPLIKPTTLDCKRVRHFGNSNKDLLTIQNMDTLTFQIMHIYWKFKTWVFLDNLKHILFDSPKHISWISKAYFLKVQNMDTFWSSKAYFLNIQSIYFLLIELQNLLAIQNMDTFWISKACIFLAHRSSRSLDNPENGHFLIIYSIFIDNPKYGHLTIQSISLENPKHGYLLTIQNMDISWQFKICTLWQSKAYFLIVQHMDTFWSSIFIISWKSRAWILFGRRSSKSLGNSNHGHLTIQSIFIDNSNHGHFLVIQSIYIDNSNHAYLLTIQNI